MLSNMSLSIQKMSEITKRGWTTVKSIVDSGFNLKKYKELTRSARAARYNNDLTFRPFNEQKTPGPVKAQEIPVKAEEDISKAQNMDDILNIIWNQQQADAKALVNKAERDEAIHKIRNGLAKVSEGLGELL